MDADTLQAIAHSLTNAMYSMERSTYLLKDRNIELSLTFAPPSVYNLLRQKPTIECIALMQEAADTTAALVNDYLLTEQDILTLHEPVKRLKQEIIASNVIIRAVVYDAMIHQTKFTTHGEFNQRQRWVDFVIRIQRLHSLTARQLYVLINKLPRQE